MIWHVSRHARSKSPSKKWTVYGCTQRSKLGHKSRKVMLFAADSIDCYSWCIPMYVVLRSLRTTATTVNVERCHTDTGEQHQHRSLSQNKEVEKKTHNVGFHAIIRVIERWYLSLLLADQPKQQQKLMRTMGMILLELWTRFKWKASIPFGDGNSRTFHTAGWQWKMDMKTRYFPLFMECVWI